MSKVKVGQKVRVHEELYCTGTVDYVTDTHFGLTEVPAFAFSHAGYENSPNHEMFTSTTILLNAMPSVENAQIGDVWRWTSFQGDGGALEMRSAGYIGNDTWLDHKTLEYVTGQLPLDNAELVIRNGAPYDPTKL